MSKRPNGDGTIAKYGDKWRGRFTDPVTHEQRAVYGATQVECKKKLSAALDSINKGVYVAPDKILVKDWLSYWFENYYCIATKQSSQSSTWQGIKIYLVPALGSIQLQRLTIDHVQALVRDLQRQGLAPSTIKRHINTLRQAMNKAVKTRKIVSNPVIDVELPSMQKHEIKFLNLEEQAALLRNLPDNTHGRAIWFLLGTGMRVSELCGLKWKDIKSDGIHIERNNLTIKEWRDDGYINVETLPKTAAGKRIIPLTDTLKEILSLQKKGLAEELMKMRIPFDVVNGYVFANGLGNPADRNNLGRSFRAICKKAGIDGRGIHALRHTFATNWVQNSPDIASLSRVLGHTDTAFTYKTYCHADANSMAAGMAMMEKFIETA